MITFLNYSQASSWSPISGIYTNTSYTASNTNDANQDTTNFPIDAIGGNLIIADGGCDDPNAGDQFFRLFDEAGSQVIIYSARIVYYPVNQGATILLT